MPVYEYECLACRKRFSWLTGVVADAGKPKCPACNGRRLRRLISRFATARTEEASDDLGADLDDENPEAARRWAREMGEEFGEDAGEDLEAEMESGLGEGEE
jgi:putative FmdB family regulatory protein